MSPTPTTKMAGIFGGGSFGYGFLDISGTGQGPFYPIGASVNAAGALVDPATEESVAAIKTAVQGTLSVSWTGQAVTANLGTLNGAATAANQTATHSAPGTSATSAETIQGSASGVPVPVSISGPLGPVTTAANAVAVTFGAGSTLPAFATNPTVMQGATIFSGGGASWYFNSNTVATAGGISGFSRIPSSAATTNLTVAKNAAGRVYKILGTNTTAAAIYIKFYNVASGAVVGTTPVLLSLIFPPNATTSQDFSDIGAYFSTGISYAMTTGTLDSDTTAISAGAMTQVTVGFQ